MAGEDRSTHPRGVRITVGDGHDLAVTPGTTAQEIADSSRLLGVPLDETWCGDVRLDPRHPAGTWPLLEGARLCPTPGLPCAPARAPTLLTIAGPRAGRRSTVGPDGIVVGRGAGADLSTDDPTVSKAHFEVRTGESLEVKDLGSANGTVRWRGTAWRRIGRPTEARLGDVFAVGSSLVAIVGPEAIAPERDPLPPDPPSTGLAARLAPLAGSAIGGIMVAAMTGRWYLAIVGLVYPAFILASQGVFRVRRPRSSWDLSALPSLLPESRRSWSTTPPRSIAIVADDEWALSFARALTLAIGRRPREGWTEPWMRWLSDPGPGDPELILVNRGDPPSWCDAKVHVGPRGGTLFRDGKAIGLPPLSLGPTEADSLARALAGEAGEHHLPRCVRWADLTAPETGGRGNLTCPLGATTSGPYVLDLDAHGPHFLVAGTTGSGKSALIETLVLGLASRYPPDRLGIALIDFKGGAGVRALRDLPHVRGLLTDLDPHLAQRALRALARELEDRKEALAEAGLSSFQEWETTGGAPPRLLVVADEYQELAAQYREFLPDLARLAAQGRSLGLHLILATQRPAGAVTPEIRANIGTTFALRVVTDSESRDLIGTLDAAAIAIDTPGRAVALTGTRRTLLQVAIPCLTPTPRVRRWGEEDDLAESARTMSEAACRRWSTHPRPAPLWLPPLPVDLAEARPVQATETNSNPTGGLWLGIGDLPAERRQPDIFWDPRSGPLAISGPPRSGRTTALRLLSHHARSQGFRPVWLPQDPREAARTIALASSLPDVLLLVDDAHRALGSLADIDHGTPLEALTSLACSGAPLALVFPKAGVHRLTAHATAFLVFTGGDPVDDASWSMPKELMGIPPLAGRARFGTAGRWCECHIGRVPAYVDEPLVCPLPRRVDIGDLEGDGFAVGIGGDDGAPVFLDPERPILLLGSPGTARSTAEASLMAVAERRDLILDLETADSLLLRPRGSPEPGAIVIAEPTERLAREAFRGSLDGLLDPHPPPRRVLIIHDGRAMTAQLADAHPEDRTRP